MTTVLTSKQAYDALGKNEIVMLGPKDYGDKSRGYKILRFQYRGKDLIVLLGDVPKITKEGEDVKVSTEGLD